MHVFVAYKLYAISGHAMPIRSLTFSPDSQLLITASDDGHIKMYDVYPYSYDRGGLILYTGCDRTPMKHKTVYNYSILVKVPEIPLTYL